MIAMNLAREAMLEVNSRRLDCTTTKVTHCRKDGRRADFFGRASKFDWLSAKDLAHRTPIEASTVCSKLLQH